MIRRVDGAYSREFFQIINDFLNYYCKAHLGNLSSLLLFLASDFFK